MDELLKRMLRSNPDEEEIDWLARAKAVNTPLSPEAKKIFEAREPDFADFREMTTAHQLGLVSPAASSSRAEYARGYVPSPERVHPAMTLMADEPSPVGLFVKAWLSGDEETQRKIARELGVEAA